VGHVMDQPNPNECLKLVKERLGIYLIPDYGPVNSVNRPVRTRTRGGVGLLLPISIIVDPPVSSLQSGL
jgi:hypothetical protein